MIMPYLFTGPSFVRAGGAGHQIGAQRDSESAKSDCDSSRAHPAVGIDVAAFWQERIEAAGARELLQRLSPKTV
jgi:hypothetical protein